MCKLKHISPPPKYFAVVIFFPLIRPYILYCSSIWLCTFPSLIRPIRVIQNNAIRVFCGVGNRESMRLVYSEINIVPATGLRDFYTLIFVYKCHNEGLPDCCSRIFCERSDVHQHNTRMWGNIEVPRLASSRSSLSLVYRASKLWNKLSKDIKDNGNFDQFKSDLTLFHFFYFFLF